jgi:KDO2-lipid IV(A) lauroyltransferase
MFERVRGRAVDLGFGAGWGLVKALPEGLSERAFRGAADMAAVRNGAGARQLRRNLRRVVPAASEAELDQLVGEGLRSYARYWLETFRLPKMDLAAVAATAGTRTEGVEYIDAAVSRGKGMILALPHMGNWDVAAIWLIHHGVPFTTVAERLKPETLFDKFVAYRESLGMEVLPLTGGQRPPADILAERLRAGGSICLLGDRDLSRNGIPVQFFGEPTRMPGGPALLAARTGATLLPVSLWFTPDGGWGQRIRGPIDLGEGRLSDQIARGTQALADVFAEEIAEHPADWHMLQRLWLADLPPRPGAATAAPVDRAAAG